MNKTVIVRLVWDMLMIIFLLGFLLSLLWHTTGSLEMAPTGEQQEKAQIAAIFSMIVTGIPCLICAVVRRQMK